MTIESLLNENGIRNAIIVDDVLDSVPTANDLSSAEDEWSNFFDDVNDVDQATIAKYFPTYEEFDREKLRKNDEFVATLWKRRNTLRAKLTDPLFETYVQDSQQDCEFIEVVKKSLEKFGLVVTKAGRDFVEAAKSSDLIVIDLYLGLPQVTHDMENSMRGLKKVIKARTGNPPIIVLMSRSQRLAEKADEFRDQTRVFASGFRTIKKSDLAKRGRLKQLLLELVRHHQDSLKLTLFVQAWQTGLLQAVKQTESDIRRLDLEDWAQIRELLLENENISTGSYILDVFDLVLLHQVESHEATIKAATALNSLQSEIYPPSTITGSKDTLALIFKTLYKHGNRHELDVKGVGAVAFGDVLGVVDKTALPKNSIFKETDNTVFLVVTPACDLQRGKESVSRVLLMSGIFEPIDADLASKNPIKPRTPILKLPDGRRVCVDWQPHQIATLDHEELDALLGQGGGACVVGRLRDINTVSIQQNLLSNLGRVGLVSPMPSTFRIEVQVFYPNQNGDLISLSIGDYNKIMGVCYVGRNRDKNKARASFDYELRFTFLDALTALDDNMVHERSLDKINKSKSIEVVDLLFSRGVELDVSTSGAQNWEAPVGKTPEILGKILCNTSVLQYYKDRRGHPRAGLIFEVHTLDDSGS